jgi:hypothetical protein
MKQSQRKATFCLIFKTTKRIMMHFLIDIVIQEEDLYVNNMHNK